MNEWLQKIRKVEKNLYEILENDENKKIFVIIYEIQFQTFNNILQLYTNTYKGLNVYVVNANYMYVIGCLY